MSSFAADANRLFGTADLYKLLNLTDSACNRKRLTPEWIKKSFFKLSLKYHPDRCDNGVAKVECTAKFQILNRAYSILSDPEKRAIYDETGMIDDGDISSENVDWETRWRSIFKKTTKADIDKFVQQYRDSGEERDDLKQAYLKHKGDMGKIMDEVIGVTYEDEERLRNMINEMIETGVVKAMRRFVAEPSSKKIKRQKAATKEAQKAELALREIEKKEGSNNLVALIQNRRQKSAADFNTFCDSLAEKYGRKRRKK